jgi:hypothetical protein
MQHRPASLNASPVVVAGRWRLLEIKMIGKINRFERKKYNQSKTK